MFKKLYDNLLDPQSIWKEIFRFGVSNPNRSPRQRIEFRTRISRECAIERTPVGHLPAWKPEQFFTNGVNIDCRLRYLSQRAFNVTWEELLIISSIVFSKKPKKIFKYGTFDGRTTFHLALNSPVNCQVFTLDLAKGTFPFIDGDALSEQIKVGERVLNSELQDKVQFLTGDSSQFDFSPYEGKIDFIFVDGDHRYPSVIRDSRSALRMLSPGGVVCWHDYLIINDVSRALIELGKEFPLRHIPGTSLVIYSRE